MTSVTKGIIVLGASGHAKVCIEILRAVSPVDFCIGDQDGVNVCHGVPVLVGDHHLVRLRDEGYSQIFVAVGSNKIRRKLSEMALEWGYTLVNAVSPRAIVSPSVKMGQGIAIMAGAVVNADVVISDFAIINTGACVDHDCYIGIAAHVAPTSGLAGGVVVCDGAFLGVGAKVIPGVKIGAHAVVGAGAVVVKNVPPGTMAIGVPARIDY